MKSYIEANVKNYKKLIKKGYKPAFPTMVISPSVKFFIITKDNFFMNSNKKP